MKNTKVAIIGASSFIGFELFNFLETYYEVIGTYYKHQKDTRMIKVDITNHDDIQTFLLKNKPHFLIWLSANKNVKECENDYESAYRLNTKSVKYVIDILLKNRLETKLIYFSSDYVFEGKRGNYKDKETDTLKPNTIYGQTKYNSEQLLNNSAIDYKIIRPCAVMGKNGVFFSWLTNALKKEKEIQAFSNIYFTPTPIGLLSEVIKNLIDEYYSIEESVLHVVGNKKLSRYEFALLIKNLSPVFKAHLIPTKVDYNNNYFQPDISLIQSDIVHKWVKKGLIEYLQQEVINDD